MVLLIDCLPYHLRQCHAYTISMYPFVAITTYRQEQLVLRSFLPSSFSTDQVMPFDVVWFPAYQAKLNVFRNHSV